MSWPRRWNASPSWRWREIISGFSRCVRVLRHEEATIAYHYLRPLSLNQARALVFRRKFIVISRPWPAAEISKSAGQALFHRQMLAFASDRASGDDASPLRAEAVTDSGNWYFRASNHAKMINFFDYGESLATISPPLSSRHAFRGTGPGGEMPWWFALHRATIASRPAARRLIWAICIIASLASSKAILHTLTEINGWFSALRAQEYYCAWPENRAFLISYRAHQELGKRGNGDEACW